MTVDFTHRLQADMPLYPGTPRIALGASHTLAANGYRQSELTLYSHVGTHVDAPAHLLCCGATLDSLPAELFHGSAVVVDVRCVGPTIPLAALQGLQALPRCDYALLHTGFDRHWGQAAYFADAPVPDAQAAAFLAQWVRKGVGIDTMSVDGMHDAKLPNHRLFLQRGLLVVENLCNLQLAPQGIFHFAALPLLYQQADGAPVRALGWEEA